jgi:coenzyme F420-reducing hydrogenase gamma subunit
MSSKKKAAKPAAIAEVEKEPEALPEPAPVARAARPTVAVFKFASCDGCQLSLLDAEDELLRVVQAVDIVYFPEATSVMKKGPYDIGLVEGSITTHHDAERIQQIRRQCRTLVTIGVCATSGGIQALRNWKDVGEFVRAVYAKPDFISTLKMSTPVAEHVPVDFELRGCPINKGQLIELLSATLAGRKPNIPTHSVCIECKRRANVCLMVARGVPCLGPVTMAGCNALCPSFDRGCFGCFGPMESPNASSLTERFRVLGQSDDQIARAFRSFSAWAWQFRQAAEECEKA